MLDQHTIARTAHYCCVKPAEIDQRLLSKAVRAVDRENNDYWDTLADNGQLHGNVPRGMCIAFVYSWLQEEEASAKRAEASIVS